MSHLADERDDRNDRNERLYHQRIEGRNDKATLVFLHEGLGCTAMWKDFPEKLCEKTGCPGLVYDRQGFGQSPPAERKRTINYLHKSALIELPELIEELLPDRSYILVGHSDGGSIGLLHGAERPENLRAIITEAAHVSVDEKTLAGIRETCQAWERGKLTGLAKYHGLQTEAVFLAWSATWLSQWFKSWNIEYLLPSIEVPLLVIQGQDDRYGEATQATTIANSVSGNSQLELVEKCGHVPHLEARDRVLALMVDFISNLEEMQ